MNKSFFFDSSLFFAVAYLLWTVSSQHLTPDDDLDNNDPNLHISFDDTRDSIDENLMNDIVSFQPNYDPFQFDAIGEDSSSSSRPRLQLRVKIDECLDATEFFSTKFTNGVNILKTFYDCECSGDLTSYFTLSCSLHNYCFMPEDKNSTELCVSKEYNYDFSVEEESGFIKGVEKEDFCFEYVKNGPVVGPICWVGANACIQIIRSDPTYTLETSVAICQSSDLCRAWLSTMFDLTIERVEELCPTTTLRGTKCISPELKQCGDVDMVNGITYTTMPDCSNVEPCATSSCEENNLYRETPAKEFRLKYPQCEEDSNFSLPPSLSPSISSSPSVSTSPSYPSLCPQAIEFFHEWVSPPNIFLNLDKYFTYECSGDFSAYFTLKCTAEDYCFMLDDAFEQCVNYQVTIGFSVSPYTGNIQNAEEISYCTKYLKNGPSGLLCYVDTLPCKRYYNDLGLAYYGFPEETCTDLNLCKAFWLDFLSYYYYDTIKVEHFCPSMRLNGVECNTYGFDGCGGSTHRFYRPTPDCSNVEPCAVSSCEENERSDVIPAKMIVNFPHCLDTKTIPTVKPTPKPSSSPIIMESLVPSSSLIIMESLIPSISPLISKKLKSKSRKETKTPKSTKESRKETKTPKSTKKSRKETKTPKST